MTKRVPITVWLTPTELATIDAIAADQQRPRSGTVVRMLNQALDNAHRLPVRITTSRQPKPGPDGPIPYPGDELAERLPGGGWREREDNRPHGYRHMPVRNIPPADEYCDESLHADPAWHCSEPAHTDGWHIAVAGRIVVAVWPVA